VNEDWSPAKKRVDDLSEEGYYRLGLYTEEFEAIQEADKYLQKLTGKAKARDATIGMVTQVFKIAGGIAVAVGVGFVAVSAISKMSSRSGVQHFIDTH